MKKNVDYWLKRLADERMWRAHKDSNQAIQYLVHSHEEASKDLQKDIDKLFSKVQGNLSREEALNILNEQMDNTEYNSLIDLYKTTKDKSLKENIKQRLNAQAYKARISRKEALQEAIYQNTIQRADTEIGVMDSLLRKSTQESFNHSMFDFQRTMGSGFSFERLNNRKLDVIMNMNWSGKHFSERVWHNSSVIGQEAYKAIESGLLSGKSMHQIAQELQNLTDLGKHATERLVRTETTYVVNEADRQSAIERGVEERQFHAILDFKTSVPCQEHHGHKYKVKDLVPGKNQPPLHPHCRSTMVDVIDGLEHKYRRVRNPETGKNEVVPFDMSYDEWFDKYAKGNEWKFKATKNESSDWKQFDKYKSILGDDRLPKSFADFQKMKYNDIAKYDVLKREYKTIKSVKSKAWSDSFKNRAISNYYGFRVHEIEFGDHALARYGQRGHTEKQVLDTLSKKANYTEFDPKTNRTKDVYYHDGIAIVRNSYTGEVITILERKNPKKGWEKK